MMYKIIETSILRDGGTLQILTNNGIFYIDSGPLLGNMTFDLFESIPDRPVKGSKTKKKIYQALQEYNLSDNEKTIVERFGKLIKNT